MQAPSSARDPYPRRPTNRSASSSATSAATSGESRIVATSVATERRGTVRTAKRAYPSFGHGPRRLQPREGLLLRDFQVKLYKGHRTAYPSAGSEAEVAWPHSVQRTMQALGRLAGTPRPRYPALPVSRHAELAPGRATGSSPQSPRDQRSTRTPTWVKRSSPTTSSSLAGGLSESANSSSGSARGSGRGRSPPPLLNTTASSSC